MSSDAPRRIVHVRERTKSADFNRAVDLGNRAMQEALFGALAGDNTNGGVVTGLTVTTDGGARTATVAPGLALMRDTGVSYPDSQYRWIEVKTAITIPIPTDTGYARWDVVEIEPGTTVTTSAAVDIWDPTVPPSGAFVPTTKDKEEQSLPVVTIRSGGDNSPDPPNFPGGVPPKLPLAYIRVDNGGAVGDGTDQVVWCRPLLRAPGAVDPGVDSALPATADDRERAWVQGGGIKITALSDNNFRTGACVQGRFAKSRHAFWINDTATYNVTAIAFDGGALPAADGPVYVYAIPPPYPSGYADLAPREFVAGLTVDGDFEGVAAVVGDQVNCIVVASETAPRQIGAQGSAAGDGSIYDWPFRSGATPASSDRDTWVYLGAFDFDQSGGAAMQQSYHGGGIVIPEERRPFTDVKNAGAYGAFDLRIPNNGTANAYEQGYLPETAVECAFVFNLLNTMSALTHQISFDDLETENTVTPDLKFEIAVVGDGQSSSALRKRIVLMLGSTVTINGSQVIANVDELDLQPVSYRDVILAQR